MKSCIETAVVCICRNFVKYCSFYHKVINSSTVSILNFRLNTFDLLLPRHKNNTINYRNIFKASQDQDSVFLFFLKMAKGGFYAVARGRQPGIYLTWDECKQQVDGFANARFKKFGSEGEAQEFITTHGNFNSTPPTTTAAGFHPKVSTNKKGVSGLSQASGAVKNKAIQLLPNIPTTSNGATATISSSLGVMPNLSTLTKRTFSTASVPDKRKILATEERITNKRQKTSSAPNSRADLQDLTVDSQGYVVVYTDGACSRNGKKGAKAGIGVWFADYHPLNISAVVAGTKQTNNAAEIQAAVEAILQAKKSGIDKLNIKTDSQFVINCATSWMKKWKTNNWKLSTGNSVQNRTDLEKLDSAMNNMDIKWSYVAGHTGDYGNEKADRLAVEGANKNIVKRINTSK